MPSLCVCTACFPSLMECLINFHLWVNQRRPSRIGPQWWSCMWECGWQHPRSLVKLLPAGVWSWGGARHTLIPQHPDLSKPVAACPQQTWQPVRLNPSSPTPASLSQCHGWARDLSSLAPLILPLWANAAPQTRNKSSRCKLKTNYL